MTKKTPKRPGVVGRDYEADAVEILAELKRDVPDQHEEWCITTGALRALISLVQRGGGRDVA